MQRDGTKYKKLVNKFKFQYNDTHWTCVKGLSQLGMVNFEQREIDLENEKIINEVILKFSTVKFSLYGNFHGIPLC